MHGILTLRCKKTNERVLCFATSFFWKCFTTLH